MIYTQPLKLKSSEVTIWFTSDLHFGHRNILKFCNRPWDTVEEMDKALINNWNSVVKKNDIVFDLGDFSFAGKNRWKELIQSLNGKHYLILGNHDVSRYPGDDVMGLFEWVGPQLLLNIDNKYIYLNHYPFLCYGGTWRKPEQAVWQLYGHLHLKPGTTGTDTSRVDISFPYQYDVGTDLNNYTPISWKQVKEKIEYQVKNNVNVSHWLNVNQ